MSWSFKIPDGPRLPGKNPFDGFAIYKPCEAIQGIPVYWESKNLKKPSSFSFKDLQPHQIANLQRIQDLMPQALCLFLVCVDYGRSDKRVYFFRDMQYVALRKGEQRNILKKEFDKRKNFVVIKKDLIDIEAIINMPKEYEYLEGEMPTL